MFKFIKPVLTVRKTAVSSVEAVAVFAQPSCLGGCAVCEGIHTENSRVGRLFVRLSCLRYK